MTANPASDPIPAAAYPVVERSGCWSTVVAAIEADGGPITPHPDPETLRRRAEHHPKPQPKSVPIDPTLGNTETPMDLDENPPAPIPARPYVADEPRAHNFLRSQEVVGSREPPRRGWLARAIRRFV